MTLGISNSKSISQFDVIMNRLRKYRTLSITIIFPILIGINILLGNKPHELAFGDELSAHAAVGLIFVIIGVLMRLWARGHFERGRLFTTGPYALIRHPLYLGSLLVVVGVLCQFNGWVNWVVALPLFVLFHGIAIVYEERSLAKKYGHAWNSYASHVPPLIPSLGSFLRMGMSEKWQWRRILHTGEFGTMLIALGLPILIEVLEDVVFEGMLHV